MPLPQSSFPLSQADPLSENNQTGKLDQDERFCTILSTMRSGSSLFGHLLAEAGWVRYAGETQTPLHNEDGIDHARSVIGETGLSTNSAAPPCDKVLSPRLLPDGGRFLANRTDHLFVLLRHPLAVWRSGKAMNWDFFKLHDLCNQLRMMREFTEFMPKEKLTVVSYYDLVDSQTRSRFFGRAIDRYQLNPHTGEPNWGDPGPLIRSGSIRPLSIEEDLEQSLKEVWMDLEDPAFLEAMDHYRAILDWVDRQDLDPALPDHIFEHVARMKIGKTSEPATRSEVSVSVDDLLRRPSVPIEDGMLDSIKAENTAEFFFPESLEIILGEFFRLLRTDGELTLTFVDLDQILLTTGAEMTEPQDLAVSASTENLPVSQKAASINEVFRKDRRVFIYDSETLFALLQKAGFRDPKFIPSPCHAIEKGSQGGPLATLSATKANS